MAGMEVLKEMGTAQVTGQEAMLFMLMERMERLEQRLEERADREASTREKLASWETRLKRQEESMDEELFFRRNTIPWPRLNPNLPQDLLTGFIVGAAGSLLMLTADNVRKGWRT